MTKTKHDQDKQDQDQTQQDHDKTRPRQNKSTQTKPPPMPKFQPKVIRDSNLDCQINPDPDVCRICRKMLWMRYLVGISHLAKYGTNQPLIVWEMLKKYKIPYSAMMKKMKKWSGIYMQIRTTTKS